ncbi:MAG: DUF86 domain-containing protein [Candidatus Ratteibacteria bacterium]|nr:DUF86 domain-containing protein [Candidatus Ratteibacteria bacterium]
MVDKDVIVSRIKQIEEHFQRISAYGGLSYEDFLKDGKTQDVIEYNLFQIVNHLIDIIQHIVVDEGYGFPQTAYEAAKMLGDKGILDSNDFELLKKMIGFRNIVGHEYIALNKNVVYSIFTKGKGDIQMILTKITERFL